MRARTVGALLITMGLAGCGQADPRNTPASSPSAEPPVPVSVRVEPNVTLGPLSRLYRPSAMLSWADRDALQAFLAIPGPLGTVRVTVEPLLTESRSLDDYLRTLAAGAQTLKPLQTRGATIVVTVARTPRWLSSSTDETPAGPRGFSVREAAPPRDWVAFERLAYETARVLRVELGLSPLYEFWNEPNSLGFWRGSRAELLRAYEAFAAGVRRADPGARVGGPAIGSWDDVREGEGTEPLLEHFLTHVGRKRAPLDFVSWHNFGRSPEEGWDGVAEIRRWLVAARLPESTPQLVDEWNRWSTHPEWLDPSRDGAVGAAYIAAAVQAMDRAGVALQSIAALQDFAAPPRNRAFVGDFGLVTREPTMRKASFHAVALLAALEATRVRVSLPPDIEDAEGLGMVATTGGGRLAIAVHRFAGDPVGAISRSLRRAGIVRSADLGASVPAIERYLRREAGMPARVTPAAREALERARTMADSAVRQSAASRIALRVTVDGWSGARYRVYLIDDEHHNPAAAYHAARRNGASHTTALNAAHAAGELRPTSAGQGALPDLVLAAHAVALVVLER